MRWLLPNVSLRLRRNRGKPMINLCFPRFSGADGTFKGHQHPLSVHRKTQKARVRATLDPRKGIVLTSCLAEICVVWAYLCVYVHIHMYVHVCTCVCMSPCATPFSCLQSITAYRSRMLTIQLISIFTTWVSISFPWLWFPVYKQRDHDSIHLIALRENEVRLLMSSAWNRSPMYR